MIRIRSRSTATRGLHRGALAAAALPLLTLAVAAPTRATVTVVTSLTDESAINGSCSLRQAIEAMNDNAAVDSCPAGSSVVPDLIILATAGTLDLTQGPLIISDDLTIAGPGSDQLTIDAGLSSAILESGEPTLDLLVTDLTLANGSSTHGGALNPGNTNGSGTYRFDRVRFLANEASFLGGAIFLNASASLELDGCDFRSNFAAENGGAIFAGANVLIEDSTFVDNRAAFAGGAVFLSGSGEPAIVRRSLFFANIKLLGGVLRSGGAMFLAADAQIESSTFVANEVLNSGVTVGENVGGGAIATAAVAVEVVNSTFVANLANGTGGAILVGGGGSLDLYFSTLARNAAAFASAAGGLHAVGSASLTHTVIADSQVGQDCNTSPATLSLGFNADSDDTCGLDDVTDRPAVEALLGGLGGWGGGTPTVRPDAASPLVDGGSLTGCDGPAGELGEDQRGLPRPIDADGVGGARCDIGSVEVEAGYAGVFAAGFEEGDPSAWSG